MSRCLLLLLALFSGSVQAHPLAPALLQLQEVQPHEYEVLWRTSTTRAGRSDVAPQLPSTCQQRGAVKQGLEEDAWVQRWQLLCPQGLGGQEIAVTGLALSRIAVILRLQLQAQDVQQVLLDRQQPKYRVPITPPASAVFPSFFQLGVEHLLLGFDHVLMVIGLVLLVRSLRMLLLTITAFTVGHSITLSLAVLGWVRVNATLMEFGIALSILWLACELVRRRTARPSLLARHPWQMALVFGLLHGLGFAGALTQIGLPQGEIPLTLLSFNLGIEAGQLMVVGVAFTVAALWRGRMGSAFAGSPMRFASMLPSYLIGTLAAFWCFERAVLLLA